MSQGRLWHVTVTVAGDHIAPVEVKAELNRLAAQHGFLHSMRYAESCAELTYWDEAPGILDAAALAMRVWDEHRVSADLPHWQVTGLEVLEQSVHARRGSGTPPLGSQNPRPVPF